MEGLHVEPVAGEDALAVAPGGVGGGAAAAGFGGVDDVVVDEGRGVDHLDDRAEADHALALVALGLGREQQEHWADALAAAVAEVVGDLGDGGDVGDGVAAEFALDRPQIVPQQIEDLFCRR